MIFRIADAQSTEPMLLSLFTRTNALVTAMNAFFQCSAIGRFDETDLRYFQQQFESAEIIENLALALRGERGTYNDFADRITGTWELFKDMHTTWARHDISMQSFAFLVYPFGYFYEDRARCNRGFAEAIAAVESRRVPDLGSMAPPAGLLYRGAFAELILPGIIEDYIPRIFDIQTQLRIAVTACAIAFGIGVRL